jgi:diacylglycerol kinase (ATP)
MAAPRALLIVNPRAKLARTLDAVALASGLRQRGIAVDVVVSERPDQPASEARSRSYDRVVAAGGDGTVRSVACAAGLPTALLPVGTSNSVARSLGIPLDLSRALDLAASGRPRQMDLGVVRGGRIAGGEQRFILCASAGVDADAARRYEAAARDHPGVLRYALAVCDALAHYRQRAISYRTGGPASAGKGLILVAANMSVYGGWFTMAPDADPFDGALDHVAVRTEGAAGLLGALARAWMGARQVATRCAAARVSSARWEADGDVPIEADGEPIGFLPADIEVLPGAIQFIVPDPAPPAAGCGAHPCRSAPSFAGRLRAS